MRSRMTIPKFATLLITLSGALLHSFLALKLAVSWPGVGSLEAETEYDNAWRSDGLRKLYLLLTLYFVGAAFVSLVGLLGAVRGRPTHVKLYRDAASADLLFTLFIALVAGVAGARTSSRATCDAPELAPLLPLIGAVLAPFLPSQLAPDEACERYLSTLGIGAASALLVLGVVRVHFLLAVNTHYAALVAAESYPDAAADGVQRIRLLPLPRGVAPSDIVYAPVHIPPHATAAAETWIRAPDAEAALAGDDAGLLDVSVVRTKREWI
ncbi:hypothetical protein MIND_01332000 [Mycena indigotica]|uniref:Uncharacterized protein n=1 Tax=Mycena indigotica TaxID=2126181 RepID=A0A8H6S198_9AGAR|nr:uncharacterized protein MIND_01332000 [Mycena indigotica]KAF7290186.1 hypothetical protein MIND_01332000 [Mycena indigotica]